MPIAYHLIWTTYGTWLPGDARGWIASGVPGVQDPDPAREDAAREMMAEPAVRLTAEQRHIVTQAASGDHRRIKDWQPHRPTYAAIMPMSR